VELFVFTDFIFTILGDDRVRCFEELEVFKGRELADELEDRNRLDVLNDEDRFEAEGTDEARIPGNKVGEDEVVLVGECHSAGVSGLKCKLADRGGTDGDGIDDDSAGD